MIKNYSLAFLLGSFSLLGAAPVITLEHAWTAEQICWGLMQRERLPDNHGMLFHYSDARARSFWSFNCLTDFSVAFIDENKIIREIKPLYAYPEKMDPLRPVRKYSDMQQYEANDPVILFFLDHAATCQFPARYVLEMSLGWFEKNSVHIGDAVHWDLSSHTAIIESRRKKAEKHQH